MTGPLVTVVVLNYNGAERIPGVLRCLAAQDLPDGQVAVWVVDNASADGSLELLRRDFPWVRTIANPTNDGFAGGNNVALREVTTPFVALFSTFLYFDLRSRAAPACSTRAACTAARRCSTARLRNKASVAAITAGSTTWMGAVSRRPASPRAVAGASACGRARIPHTSTAGSSSRTWGLPIDGPRFPSTTRSRCPVTS